MSNQRTNQPRILDHFSICTDPRTRPVQYPLMEIIIVIVLATLCGEEGWEAIMEWGEDKLDFLQKFLPFHQGIPSPDTLRRVTERLNPQEFLNAFVSWAQELKKRTSEQICIDGKTLRNAIQDGKPLHIVTAWSEANRMVLGSVKTPSKKNEITAIHNLLNLLILRKGDIATIDAIGCQKTIVSKIRDQQADYVIAVKKNQHALATELENFFDQAIESPEKAPCIRSKSQKSEHGRKESHEIWVSQDLDWLPQVEKWKDLHSIILVVRNWNINGKKRTEKRYYISSLQENAECFGNIIRRHWSIENELHWQLDVTFREDTSQIGGEANENLRVARMVSLELLRSEPTFKPSLKARMKRCHRSDTYLEKVLMAGNF